MPIGDHWRPGSSDSTRADVDPWSGETLTEIVLADAGDLDEAYASAAAAQRDWAARPPDDRASVLRAAADVLDQRREEVVGWLVRESGGTLAKAQLECDLVEAGLLEAASIPHHVAGSILPSTFPARRTGSTGCRSAWWRSSAPGTSRCSCPTALWPRRWRSATESCSSRPATRPSPAGCCWPASSRRRACPPACSTSSSAPARRSVMRWSSIRCRRVVSFTGSTPVGAGSPRRPGLKKLALELGGNGPLVVLDDADLELAVDAAVFGSFFHQGQICMIANRVVADAAVHDEFVERLVERVGELHVGDPSDPDSDLGPIINDGQLASIQDKLARARDAGAEQLLGGEPSGPTGLALPPHVLVGSNEVATAREEVFGPVITVIRADGEDDALAIANDTEYGLSSAVFTRDTQRGVDVALRLQAGMTHVNDSPVNEDANTAFGGEKASGIGRFGGAWAIDEFTTDHWVSVQHERRRYPI